jgi:putative Holliday junction resolvase
LGLDLGSRRIGVSISDSDGRVATPIEVVARSGSVANDHRRIAALVTEWEAEIVVVGLPLSLDGSVGPAAQGVLDEIATLERAVAVPVTTYDERLTTVTADRSLMELGQRSHERRRVVDMVAAAVLLQGWLDRERGTT